MAARYRKAEMTQTNEWNELQAFEVLAKLCMWQRQNGLEARAKQDRTDCRQNVLSGNLFVDQRQCLLTEERCVRDKEILHAPESVGIRHVHIKDALDNFASSVNGDIAWGNVRFWLKVLAERRISQNIVRRNVRDEVELDNRVKPVNRHPELQLNFWAMFVEKTSVPRIYRERVAISWVCWS